jgi:hypothetical protein
LLQSERLTGADVVVSEVAEEIVVLAGGGVVGGFGDNALCPSAIASGIAGPSIRITPDLFFGVAVLVFGALGVAGLWVAATLRVLISSRPSENSASLSTHCNLARATRAC